MPDADVDGTDSSDMGVDSHNPSQMHVGYQSLFESSKLTFGLGFPLTGVLRDVG